MNAQLSDANIRDAYVRICRLFKNYEVPATFAFVALFLLNREQAARELDRIAPALRPALDRWLADYHSQAGSTASDSDGWHLPELADIVANDGLHEIASHGFTHFPLCADDSSDEMAKSEITNSKRVLKSAGFDPASYIFARNEMRCVDHVGEAGFSNHRAARAPGPLGRAGNLANEFIPRAGADAHLAGSLQDFGSVAVPAGRFFNFAIGARRYVPRALTVRRWNSILDDAAENGGVAHIWFHPHNGIIDAGGLDALDGVLQYAAVLREKGKLRMMTMEGYAERHS